MYLSCSVSKFNPLLRPRNARVAFFTYRRATKESCRLCVPVDAAAGSPPDLYAPVDTFEAGHAWLSAASGPSPSPLSYGLSGVPSVVDLTGGSHDVAPLNDTGGLLEVGSGAVHVASLTSD